MFSDLSIFKKSSGQKLLIQLNLFSGENDLWMVLYLNCKFGSDWKFKMAAIDEQSLTYKM